MNGTAPSSLRAVPAVMLVLLGACDNGRVVVDLQVVEITLPQEGVYVGADTAPVALVEFGSYACPLCRRFATEVFPRIETRFVQPGVLKYRYVNLSPPGASKRGPALVECLSPAVGFPSARRWFFNIGMLAESYAAALAMAAEFAGTAESTLTRCVDRTITSSRWAEELDAATQLEVPGTPTFIIGSLETTGRLVGWVWVGLGSADTLGYYIEHARRRISQN